MLDALTGWAQSGVVLFGFFSACVVAAGVIYRRVFRPVHQRVERILTIADYQFTENGGGSLLDKVNRIGANQVVTEAHWKQLEAGQVVLATELKVQTTGLEAGHEELSQALAANTAVTVENGERLAVVEEQQSAVNEHMAHIDGILNRTGVDLKKRETAILTRLDAIEVHTSGGPPKQGEKT